MADKDSYRATSYWQKRAMSGDQVELIYIVNKNDKKY